MQKLNTTMAAYITLSPDDISSALLRRVRLPDIENAVLRRVKLPLPKHTASSALFMLRRLSAQLADMLSCWINGNYPDTKPGKAGKVIHAPFCPRDISVATYLQPLVKKYKPAVIAIDASPAETGAALHYACSLFYGLQLPAKVDLVRESTIQEEVSFQPGDFLPELTVFCLQHKIPLIPLGTPPRLVPSEHQYTYNELLQNAYSRFTAEKIAGMPVRQLEKLAAGFIQHVFTAGMHLVMEREDVINQSCYVASRLFDLARFLSAIKYSKGPILTLYKMKHVLDFPSLVTTMWQDPAAAEELYSPVEPQCDGTFEIDGLQSTKDEEEEIKDAPQPTKLSKKIGSAIEKCLTTYTDKPLLLHEVDDLCSAIAQALRSHPLIERPSGVRGTLAAREIVQAYGLIRGSITRKHLAQAAYIAFRHRIQLRQGQDTSIEEVLKGIFSRLIYGIPLHPAPEETAAKKRRALTAEELSKALMGITEAAFQSLPPDEGLPVDDPAFAEEAFQHPLVQQALKDALEQGLLQDIHQDFHDLLNEFEERGYLDQLDSSHLTLTEDGQQQLRKSLEESLASGEITPEELVEKLKNAQALPLPPGPEGEKMYMPPQAETELIAEMMDFQHQGRSESTSLEDLYVHYTLGDKKGMKVSKDKLDYEKLKIMLHEMEKKGSIKISGEKKKYTLSHLSLQKLLDGLVRRQDSQVLERRAFKREHETDKTEIRRYKRGDVFRDLSSRHTLRRITRKGKTLEEINYTDLRAFEKKPSNQLDIAVCVDISASMKESAKLRYAKMAVAELSKAAIDKHDRMGIVAFSNLGEVVVPLTDKLTPLLEATMVLRAEQYTNIGNGLACARKMLLKDRKSNPKYIILITDGQPNAALSAEPDGRTYHAQVASFSRETSMERKKALGTHHALIEAGKTSREHIKISVVFICPQGEEDQESERTAREIARIGAGKFHKVTAIDRLPLEALATVA